MSPWQSPEEAGSRSESCDGHGGSIQGESGASVCKEMRKINKQQGDNVQHREFYPLSCNNL